VIVRCKLPVSKIAVSGTLKIVSYLPSDRYGRMSISLSLNQQERSSYRQDVAILC
jgi:hypothetical protein